MYNTYIIALVLTALMVACRETAKEGGATESWQANAPELIWKYEGLGRGYGGPLIADDGIYVNAEEDGKSYTVCLDHKGSFRWRSPNGKAFMGMDFSASYPGTRSIPAVQGAFVYAISGLGHISCFKRQSGEVIWSVDLVKNFQGKPGDFGYSESPVMDGKNMYCFTGGSVHNIVALDLHTGELSWSSPVKRDSFAYSTPI